jgi:peptidoglycan hydrolase-like protein with peptidoglycan-binding domain
MSWRSANKRCRLPSKSAREMKIALACLTLWIAMAGAALADSQIADVQQALKDQGFYYGQINGQKDADTTAAIRRFQIRNGLQITGDLNDETLRSIRAQQDSGSQSRAAAAAPTAAPRMSVPPDSSDLRADAAPQTRTVDPPPGQAVPPAGDDESQQPPITGRVVPAAGGVFAGTPYETAPIQVQRRVIADAQRILARRGLFREATDGGYSAALEFSLRAYQSRVGLPATGRLDLETLAALQLLPASHSPHFRPRRRIMPAPPPLRGEWIRP